MNNKNADGFEHYFYSDDHKSTFYRALGDASKLFGCQYISYVYENPTENIRMGFSTNPDWQRQYIAESLIDDCHLWKSVLKFFVNTNRMAYVLPWETAVPETERQQEILCTRDQFDIGRNGVSFCTQSHEKREFLAFAPATCEKKFAKYLVANMDGVRKIASLFRAATDDALTGLNKEN